MTPDQLLAYCLAKAGAWQDEPWEGDVVAKVGKKIFAFLGPGTSVGVKCGRTREAADEWLQRYPDDASAMAYIGRSGWNTLRIGGAIPDDEIREAIDTSYDAVVATLPRKDRPAVSLDRMPASLRRPAACRSPWAHPPAVGRALGMPGTGVGRGEAWG